MQLPNYNPPIKSICTGAYAASSSNPVFIIGTYYDNETKGWYRKYSDGTIVQGGYGTDQVKDGIWVVNFIIPFTTTNIQIHITPVFNKKPAEINGGMAINEIANDKFKIHGDTNIQSTEGYYWEARGM